MPAQNTFKNALLHAFLRLSTGDAFGGVSSGVRDIGRTTFTEAHVADLQRLLNKSPDRAYAMFPQHFDCRGDRLLRNFRVARGTETRKGDQATGYRGAMIERPPTADDDDTRSVLSRTAKLIIAIIVFAFGMLAGTAIAAWIMPPS